MEARPTPSTLSWAFQRRRRAIAHPNLAVLRTCEVDFEESAQPAGPGGRTVAMSKSALLVAAFALVSSLATAACALDPVSVGVTIAAREEIESIATSADEPAKPAVDTKVHCSGVPKPCNSYGDENSCRPHKGCYWSYNDPFASYGPGGCWNVPVACAETVDKDVCESGGCIWTP